MEGNLRFKIDWASLIVERQFTFFALYYFVFEGNCQVQAPGGAYIWRGELTESFLRYEFGGLRRRGLYTEGLIFGILRYVCERNAGVKKNNNKSRFFAPQKSSV